MSNNRFHYPLGVNYAPPLCKECPQYELLKVLEQFTPTADATLTEADYSLVPNRTCERGRKNDATRACRLILDERSPLAQYLAGQTGKNQV